MAPTSGIPTHAAILAELDDIWPGWRMLPANEPASGQRPCNPNLHPRNLPTAWQRRVKWLIKWYHLIAVGYDRAGWGVELIEDPRRLGHWFCHAVPARGWRPEDEPARVVGPPPGMTLPDAAQARVARPTAAELAISLRLPLATVRERLLTAPADADLTEWVRGQHASA